MVIYQKKILRVNTAASIIFQLPAPPECIDDSFNFCGDDSSKYPEDTIAEVLNRNEELKSAVLTLRKFFQPEIQRANKLEILDKLACTAIKKKIPRYTRAKNVNGIIALL